MRYTSTVFITILLSAASANAAEVVVEDIFGRRLNEYGLILVDWEGEIANPAIKFFVVPPDDAEFPARATLTSTEPRIYFDLPSEIGAQGPSKAVEFADRQRQPVLVSIFPSREEKDENYGLNIEFEDARGRKQVLKLTCYLIDQDKGDQKVFPITVDFSRDRTGFFKDEKKRQVVTQAAQDWMYFFEPLPLAPVPAGKEQTFIWNPDGFKNGQHITNAREYTGYLLYAYGIQSAELRSGGEPSSAGGFQSLKGKRKLTIRRSGGLEIETRGNFNKKGWLVSNAEADYWKATNEGHVANDLYSIAKHEIGHSLVFDETNPVFETAWKNRKLVDPALREYLRADLKIDDVGHLDGTIDPASRRGAFGYEYYGDMPLCRWQISKVDLLCAQAIGWPLRKTSPFVPLQLETEKLSAGVVGSKFKQKFRASGGIPFYHWEITSGSLPAGLSVNSFSGAIRGTPTKAGVFEFTVRVRDYDEKSPGQSRKLRMEIGPR